MALQRTRDMLGTPCARLNQTMAWFVLLLAGLFEVAWAVGLRYTEHFSRPGPTAATVVAMVLSVVLLERAVRVLPLGTAYAVWTGIGAVGTALVGILLHGDPASAARIVCLALIVSGIIGLKLLSPS